MNKKLLLALVADWRAEAVRYVALANELADDTLKHRYLGRAKQAKRSAWDLDELMREMDSEEAALPTATSKEKIDEAIEILKLIARHTTCPDPGEGGCIGGPIPGYGCVREAVNSALRRLEEE